MWLVEVEWWSDEERFYDMRMKCLWIGATHFAKHFFMVEVYRFDARQDRYAKTFKYRTTKKYPSLDEVDEVHVIEPERREIMRRLESISKASRQ